MKKLARDPRALALVVVLLPLILWAQTAFAHGMSEQEKQAIVDGGNMAYLWLGATHMLSGYDHLAFVFGIIFFLTSFREIAKYITAFTLGHSVTLILATFIGVQLNYFLIDAVIGLSVSYIAFHNIDGFRKYLGVKPPNILFMIVGLGLIHGFGLSTRLQDLPLTDDGLLLNIISFNLGVELGQVSALAVMLLVVAAWRKRDGFETFSRIANYGLIIWGGLLFLMQMHGYEHASDAAEAGVRIEAAQEPEADVGAASDKATSWKDTIFLTIPARSDTEYKFRVEAGGTLEYEWSTDGPELFFDFHGEPTGAADGYFESFEKGTRSESGGTLTATFEGTHGWYWKNSGTTTATVTLKARGAYDRLD
jgi:hypothetical protein